eukprot:271132_1
MDENKGRARDDLKFISVLNQAGYINLSKITTTLQGSIWRALEVSSNSNIVIKITSKYLHEKSMAIVNEKMHSNIKENICLEAGILKYLCDQNNVPKSIIKYHTFLQSDEAYFLIIDYGGSSLFDFMVQAHKLISMNKIEISEWISVVKIIFKQMVECIEYIHSKCIIFRDLKLENIILDQYGNVKITDFGAARKCSHSNSCIRGNVGTPGYMDPRVMLSQYYDKSVDLFSLGVVLYRMISNKKPFDICEDTKDVEFIGQPNIIQSEPSYSNIFSAECKNICCALLTKNHKIRLGANGINEIKQHPLFDNLDWVALTNGYLKPPFVPSSNQIYATEHHKIKARTPSKDDKVCNKKIKLKKKFNETLQNLSFDSSNVLQNELVQIFKR